MLLLLIRFSELDEYAVQQFCSTIAQWLATAKDEEKIELVNEFGKYSFP